MSTTRYRCWTKATDRETGGPRRSANWVVSRRGWFNVFDHRVECGDWVIEASAVREAVLFETRQLFIPVYVLRLRTAEATYQFGFNPWCRVAQHLPFEVERRQLSLSSSPFSTITRIVVLLLLAYWLWQRFG